MELKNLLSKKTQQAFSTAGQGIQKKFKPVIDVAQEAGTAIKQEFSPMVENVSNAATNIAKPIVEPIQQAQQRTQAIGEINTFFSDAGITLDDIKALAEDEGIDPNEVITKFQKNGIKVQGMEELQAQEQAKVAEEANKPFQLDINPQYDEVTALSKLTGAIPKFQDQPNDSPLTSVLKSVGNYPANAVQIAGAVGDTGLSYLRNLDQGPIDAFTETAKAKIINPTIAQAYDVKNIAQEGYKKGGVLGATEGLVSKAKGFAVENPVSTMMTVQGLKNVKRGGETLKTAGQEAMQGNIGKATAGLAKSTGIGLKENIVDPIKMGVTAPIKLAQLGAKGVGVVAKKAGIKAPERVQNISNNMAERMLSSQWKLTKPIRKELEGKIGQSGPKFALENDLVGKDIESTADNAGVFKIDKIKEKIEAVKTFGKTETPSVAKNVAQVLKSDIEASVEKSYGKGKTQKVLDENHPELAGVYRLADEITKSNEIDYVKLEQLKELHDYLNPENIQYDISGKPISETRNILSAGKRQKLQQILEAEGQKRGIDIKKINKDIQGAYTLEKGLNDTVGRIANLNILGLGDTQTAVISSILGGAPGAVGGILLKKGLTSEGFVGGLAKSIYSKKNASTNNSNPSGDMTPPVTRLGRIMNNSSDTVTPKVEPKGVTPKPKTEGVTPKVVKPSSTTPTKQKEDIVSPKKKENTPIVKKEAVKPNERSYNLIAVNERTGEKTILTKTPTTQDKAITMKNKFSDREGRRIQLEEVTPKPLVKNLQKTEKSGTIGDMENPIVNKQTGETLNQAIEKLRKNNWSEKDISKYRESVLGKKENIAKKEGVLDTVNPTGGLFVDYTPSKRANSIISSKDLTTLDKTLGKSPDDYITIYRGTVKGQKEMNPGDFVTDMPELAKSYAGGDKIVISKRVKYSDVIDDIENGGANEYLYIPKEMQKWDNKPKTIVKPMGDMETKKLIEEARIKPNSENYSKFTKSASDFISELKKNKGIFESAVSKTNFSGNLKAHDDLIEVVKKSTDSKKLSILKEKWIKDLSGKTSPTTAFTIDLLRVIDEQLAKIK